MDPSSPLNPKSAELLTKAEQAFDIRNYEYAVVLYQSVLEQHPDNHQARFMLHLSRSKFEQMHPKPWWFLLLQYARAAKSFSTALWKMRIKDWPAAVWAWERCLGILPRLGRIHFENARCLELLGWTQAAIDEYILLRSINPLDPAPLWELARLYCQENRWENAREAYETIQRIRPDDPRVSAELRKIAAIATIERGGWQDMGTYREKIRDEQHARFLEQQERLVKSAADIDAMLDVLAAKRTSQPQDPAVPREMAKLFRLKGDLSKAKETLQEALKITPADFFLSRELRDVQREEMAHEIARARAEASSHPEDQGAAQALEKLLAEYRRAELTDKRLQVTQYPTNLLLRFELGELYLQQDLVDEAISEFQQAVKNPTKRLEARKFLGECFKRKHLYDLAVEQLKGATEAIKEMTPLKKDILYELASVYEQMGKTQDARREYEKIYTVDIAFKDVAQKIEKKYREFRGHTT